MPLPIARKRELVQTHARTPNDSGSPEVQVALLSGHIEQLTQHLDRIRRTIIRVSDCCTW